MRAPRSPTPPVRSHGACRKPSHPNAAGRRRRVTLLALVPVLCACATATRGTRQEVHLVSTPPNAWVIVDGETRGTTPLTVKLARRRPHVVRFELDGYQPLETTITSAVEPGVWRQSLLGTLIGVGVDAASGAWYRLTPSQLPAVLQPKTGDR